MIHHSKYLDSGENKARKQEYYQIGTSESNQKPRHHRQLSPNLSTIFKATEVRKKAISRDLSIGKANVRLNSRSKSKSINESLTNIPQDNSSLINNFSVTMKRAK